MDYTMRYCYCCLVRPTGQAPLRRGLLEYSTIIIIIASAIIYKINYKKLTFVGPFRRVNLLKLLKNRFNKRAFGYKKKNYVHTYKRVQ